MTYFFAPGTPMGKLNKIIKRNPGDIINIICTYFGVTYEQIVVLVTRKQGIVVPRQLAMVFIFKYCRMTKCDVARIFKQDHTTVIHNIKKVSDLFDTDEKYRHDYLEIQRLITA